MLGEKRSQNVFGLPARQAASAARQRAGMEGQRDSQEPAAHIDRGKDRQEDRKAEAKERYGNNGGQIKVGETQEEIPRVKGTDMSEMQGIRISEGSAEKESFSHPVFHTGPRNSSTATAGVTTAQVHTVPMESCAMPDVEEDESVQFQQGGTALRTHDLFFSPQDNAREFSSVLQEVQEYISNKYSTLILEEGGGEIKEQIKRYITKYVQDYRIAVKGMSSQELVDTIYTEMAEFSFLTKYVFGTGIEEIDINSWKDIEVQYAGGETRKLEEQFESPQHAINVVRRMLHTSGMVLDNASPAVLGHLSKNIRIAAMKTPLVDEDIGVVASIRIVNPQSMQASDFIKGGTATAEMLDFLTECVRYGISVCVAGATSSGKTTLMGWLLTTIPDKKRIYTIESGSRELALVREKEGRVSNSVIHTLTRDSENDRQRVDQIALLDMALRFNPDVIVVGEMRGPEANAAQEAARTGVAVITTIHSNSCEATYRRMVSLCKRAVDMSDETLMAYVTEAYPIVAFCKQLENRQRRLMEILECEILTDGSRKYRPLFRYEITENRMEEGRFIIEGGHRKVNAISEGLARRLTENGMPGSVLERLRGGMST